MMMDPASIRIGSVHGGQREASTLVQLQRMKFCLFSIHVKTSGCKETKSIYAQIRCA